MDRLSPGVALIICSPSGGGKSTLISLLIKAFSNFSFSVSYTTRSPRPGEQHGREYFFVDQAEFEALTHTNFFAEWARVHSHYYGTPLKAAEDLLDFGRDIIFDVDVQGARQLKHNIRDSITIFIFPPSLQVLEQRLTRRGSDEPGQRAKRLQVARDEIGQAKEFDYFVLNQDLDQAFERLKSIYLAEKCRSPRNEKLLAEVLKTWEEQDNAK